MRLSTSGILGIALAVVLALLVMAPSAALSQAKPDLAVEAILDPPTSGLPGDSFVVTATVRNQGTGAADASVTKFFLVSTTRPARKNLKGVQNVPALGIADAGGPAVTVSIYSDTLPDTYLLQGCADGAGTVSESNEINNCRATVGIITVSDVPDLAVTALSNPPASVPQGQKFSVTDTVENQGAVPAALSSTVKYLLVSTADGSRTALKGKQTVPPLAPGQTFTETQLLTVRPETLPGSYNLQACADSGKVVTEKDENDNCRTAGGIVQVTPAPDLVVTQATVTGVPLTIIQGDPVGITAVVRNQGLVSSLGSTLKFVLVDTATAAQKNLKGTAAVAAIPQGAEQTVQASPTVYGDTAPGTYNVQVCADSGKVVTESVEGNNCTAAPGTVTVEGAPLSPAELALTSLTEPPATALPKDAFQVTAAVKNKGSGPAGVSTTTKFSLKSSNGQIRKNLKGIQIVPDIGAGVTSAVAVTVELYSDTLPGAYFLEACADSADAVNEAVETNNCRTSLGQVTVQDTPDLVVTAIGNPPSSAFPNQAFSVTDTVKNVGGVPALASTGKFYLVSTADGSRIDLKGSQSVPALNPAQTFSDSTSLQARPETVPGLYRVQACADSGKVVVERNEDDNCKVSTGTVQIKALPDLIVTSVTVAGAPVTVARGGTLAITAPVKNQGFGDAGASTTKFVLVLTPGAAPVKNLNGTQTVPALAAGAQSGPQITVGVYNDTPPGTYFVQACADNAKVVPEISNSNNCATSTGTVTVQ